MLRRKKSEKNVEDPLEVKKDDVPKTDDEKSKDRKTPDKDVPTRKYPRWITRAMAEEFSREELLRCTLRDMIMYIIFFTCCLIVTHSDQSPTLYHMSSAISGIFLERSFKTENDVEINFEQIETASDFWHYAESQMVESLYTENYYDDKEPIAPAPEDDRKILFSNQLLGLPRLRQVKVRNDSCIIHEYFRRLFVNCYDMFSSAEEDQETFGPGTETAWVYSDQTVTKSLPYSGRISSYTGGGFYVDLKQTRTETARIIAELKDKLWITRGTRAIFLDFNLYNANLDVVFFCKLVFELPPTGGVISSREMRTFFFMRQPSRMKTIVLYICQLIVFAFAAFYLMEEIRTMLYFEMGYFFKFWSYIDLSIIAIIVSKQVLYVVLIFHQTPALETIKQYPNKYGNLEYVWHLKATHHNVQAALLFFLYLKIFKYLNFNKRMGQLNNTLKRCAKDILGFAVMFFIIFCAFVELGYLLFGSQVDGFSNFGKSMFTLLRTILGDFNYAVLEDANRVLAPIYFLSYIFLVFFVLLNMFLAIINDTYADVKTEIAIAPEEMQMTDFVKAKIYELLKKLGCNVKKWVSSKNEFSATIQQIREALTKCQFSDLEIEMFFSRYQIEPLTEVKDYDMQRLMTELKNQQSSKEEEEEVGHVQLSDFINQQEKLDQIEHVIALLANKVDALVKKLETIERARNARER